MDRQVRVLHVDDDSTFTEETRTMLHAELEGVSVETEARGERALERLQAESFDCVISEYALPDMNGLELVTAVRTEHPTLPYIVLTTADPKTVGSEALSSQGVEYLSKDSEGEYRASLVERITEAREGQMESDRSALFPEIVDEAAEVLFTVDGTFSELEYISTDHHKLWDVTTAELEADPRSIVSVTHEADCAQLSAAIDAMAGGTPERVDFRVADSSGDWRWLHIAGQPVERDGRIERIVGSIRDITDRKRRERELEHSLDRTRQALEHTDSVISEIDCATGEITRHGPNPQFTESGPAGSTWQDHCREVVYSEDREEYRSFFEELISGNSDEGTLIYRTVENDTINWVRNTIRAVEGPDGSRQLVAFAQYVTEQTERQRELEETRERLNLALSAGNIGIWEWDRERELVSWSASLARMLGVDPAETPETPSASLEHVHPADRDKVKQTLHEAIHTAGGFALELRLKTADESYRWAAFRGQSIEDSGERSRILGIVSDITERWRYRRRLEEVQARTRELMHTRTATETAEIAVTAAANELEATAAGYFEPGNDDRLEPKAFADPDNLFTELPVYCRGDEGGVGGFVWSIFESASTTYLPDVQGDEKIPGNRPVNSAIFLPIEDQGLLIASSADTDAFAEADQALLQILATALTEALERAHREEELREREAQIEAINEVTREAFSAETPEAVAEIGIQAGREVIGFELTAIYRHPDDTNRLEPVAYLDPEGVLNNDPPVLRAGESLAWDAFEAGELVVFDDLRGQPDRYNPDTPIRSEIVVPLDEYGVLMAGSSNTRGFDIRDQTVTEMLGRNLTAAFDQIAHQVALEERTERLAEQNKRLEQFASIVSHDLRNPLNVAMGRVELARSTGDEEHLDALDQVLGRMDNLVDDLLALARHGDSVRSMESIRLDEIATTSWNTVETKEATLDIETEDRILGDWSRCSQLFENLYRNAIEHGAVDITVRVGSLADGFYIEDDGPGIPSEERDRVFDIGYSTDPDGTGFGLGIVDQIVDAHDWSISITDGDLGGARFEIRNVDRPAPDE